MSVRPKLLAIPDRTGRATKLALRSPAGLPGATYGARKSEKDEELTYFPPEPLVLRQLQRMIPDLEIGAETQTWIDNFAHWETTSKITRGVEEVETALHPGPYPRRHYQCRGVNWLKNLPKALLGDEPGLGKTNQIISSLGKDDRATISAPTYLLAQWQEELRDWGDLDSVIVGGIESPAERKRLIASNPQIILINPEMLQPTRYPELLTRKVDLFAIDEAHGFQGRNSLRTLGARAIASAVDRLILATGTPIWKNPDSIWQLLALMDPLRFTSYWTFAEYFCEIEYSQWGMDVKGPKLATEPELRELIAPYLLRRKSDDPDVAPELPDVIPKVFMYDPTPAQRKAYRDAKKNAGDFEGIVTTMFDWRMICSMPEKYNLKGDPKLNLFKDILKDHVEDQIVIFTWHVDVAKKLAALLKVEAVYGESDGAPSIAAFKAGKQQYLVGTIASMGTGLNLQISHIGIFYEEDFVPAPNDQALRRIAKRLGQKHTTLIYYLLGRNTCEVKIHNLSVTRQEVSDRVLAINTIWEQSQ
jgi:SNF2 family DNA or RNA helicase